MRYSDVMARIAKRSGTYHHGDLRRVLLETAVRVIESEGVTALNLQALARRAGVSSGAPYYHFENREQLLVAIADQGFELFIAELKRAADEAGDDAVGRLRGLGLGYVRFAVSHPGHFRVMFRPDIQSELANASAAPGGEGFAMLRDAVARCQKEGLAPSGNPMPLTLVAWSCVHGASALWVDGNLGNKGLVRDEEDLAAVISTTISQLIAGGDRRASVIRALADRLSAKP
jgi:AcrR family transcriptional regulator